MPARLTICFAMAPAREMILDRETIVGRGPECGVRIEDDRVSRRHAVFTPAPAVSSASSGRSGWTVRDLGSKNGTLIDGVPAARGRLAVRSWISFGGVIVRFEVVQGSAVAFHEERYRRLTTALEARRELDPAAGLQSLLARVVTSMLGLTNAERGFVLLAGEDGGLDVAARSGISWDDLRAAEFGGSAGAVEQALASGRAVVISDAQADAELGVRPSVVAGGIRALVCAPLQALDRRIGVLYADSRTPGAVFTELDLEILEALSTQAGLAIAAVRLNGELRGLAERIAPQRSFAESWHGLLAAHAPAGAR